MTAKQESVLQEANVRRSQSAARERIVKALEAGKINRGRAVLLLTAHAGMYRHQAVNAVTEVSERLDK